MTKFAHIFSKGERVLFRDEEDYVSFNNKLAVESYMTRVGILGMSIMSTHFHCVVEYLDDEMLEVFKERIKMSYCISYARKYAGKISSCFNISNMPLEDVYSIRRALVYVLKNPVHHKVTSFALKYEFSTSSKIFMTELNPPGMVETYMKSLVSLGEIKGKRRRRITMDQHIPDTWLADEKDMISPLSYINIGKARAIWNGYVSQFLFDMNASTRDVHQEEIPNDVLELRSRCYDDVEVCRIIEKWTSDIGKISLHLLTGNEKLNLASLLFTKGIPKDQVSRCLWY